MKIIVSQEIEQVCPGFIGAAVEAQVMNTPYCEELWKEIHALGEEYRTTLTTESIKQLSGMLQGKELYQIDTLVDLINLASIRFGYSIGGFDADKFHGDTLTLGVGKKDEPYEGIGRGQINIEGLPVYRDATGGVGTPTSDHERTKIDIHTTHLLTLINGYDGNEKQVTANAQFIQSLLRKYCNSDGGTITYYR